MSIFKQTLLAATLCGVFGVAAAAPEGGSSQTDIDKKPTTVKPGESDSQPFGKGKAGLAFSTDNGHSWSNSINLENGPVKHIGIKYKQGTQKVPINGNNPYANVDGTRNPKHLRLGDVKPVVGWFYNPKLGQVWYENRHNNTEVYSVRQITEPKLPFAPKFGGLVIAKVPGMGEGNNVFFGEWAPRKGNPPDNSTDLNMADGKRTVWYVGDNPIKNTTGLATATYNVVGINKHTPGKNDFYTGEIKATFGTDKFGSMSGVLKRAGDKDLSFNGVQITNSKGTFNSIPGRNNEGITGQFYGNGAAAMAGYAERGNGKGDDVAFGGAKK